MIRNILLQKVILLRRGLIRKLLLSDVWPTSTTFTNFLAVLGIPVTELHCSPAHKFSLLKTTIYTKNNAYSGAHRKRIIINIFKHLNQLEKPRIWVEKRVTLAKFRRFVVPKYQDYWMYQYPSAEDIKLAKETSKKRNEMQKSTVANVQR